MTISDPLSEIVRLLKPQKFIAIGLDAGGDWAMRYQGAGDFLKCYAVECGSGWLSVEGERPIPLHTGDCVILPSGRNFVLGSALEVEPRPTTELFRGAKLGGVVTLGKGGDLFLIGSRFTMGGHHAAMLLKALPPIMRITREDDQAAFRWSLNRMRTELREGRPGIGLAAEQLSYMILLQTLRMYLQSPVSNQPSWFNALGDHRLARAIGAIHEDPARPWTLGELATVAGMSRSTFAKRFAEKVGETTISYLIRWRMMLAAERLSQGSEPLARIAVSLGYASESAFNTAFRRVMGCSPRKYGNAKVDQQFAR